MYSTHDVQHEFTAARVDDPSAKQHILRLEVAFRDLAVEITDLVPNNASRRDALKKLLVAKWTATHAISHHQTTTKENPNATVQKAKAPRA